MRNFHIKSAIIYRFKYSFITLVGIQNNIWVDRWQAGGCSGGRFKKWHLVAL